MSVLAKGVVESVAKALSGEYGVTVTFHGNDCYTDGKQIVLPSLPDEVPDPLIEILRGYLDHEVGHIIFTDFNVITKAKDPLEKLALNAIEDLRIEQEMEKIWRGCAINFEKTESRVDSELSSADWDRLDPIVKIFFLFMRVARRGWDHPWALERMGDFGPILDDLTDEAEKVPDLKSTEEALQMARRILEKIQHAIEEAKARKAPPKEEGGEDPSDEKDSAKVSEIKIGDKDASKEETEAPDKIELAGEVKITIKKDETPEVDVSTDDKSPIIELPSELIEEIEKSLSSPDEREMPSGVSIIIKEAVASSGVSGYWRPYSLEKDSFTPPSTKISMDKALEKYEMIRSKLGGIIGVLKGQLLRILLSKKRSKWTGGKREGSINPAALPHIIHGTSDMVYRQRQEGTKINTAVSITVDLSGSMNGNKIIMAQKTTALLAETLSLLNIPFEILGFTGDWETNRVEDSLDTHFTRWGSLDIVRLKTFDEPFGKQQRANIGKMTDIFLCQNYDGESVLFAAKRLLERREKKKIQFVLSDGEPAAACCRSEALTPHLRKVVKELEAIPDYYLCGFGILTPAPQRFYKNHVLVDRLEELPKTLMESLFKALILE